MFDIQRILAATDFSAHSVKAESRAALLCKELRLNVLELLNVRSAGFGDMLAQTLRRPTSDREAMLVAQALCELRRAAQRLRSGYGIRCRYAVRIGETVSEVLASSQANAADMIVIGDRDAGFFEKLIGTPVDKLVRMSGRPVLLVRNAPVHSYREVLVPVDFSPASRHAARFALRMAPKANITFLHAFRVWAEGKMREAGVYDDIINAYRMKYREQARQELNQFIEELGPISQEISRVVQFGAAVPVITSYASKLAPDLIVMGKHSDSRVEDFLIGNVTRRTIDQTSCDVLIASSQDSSNKHWCERPAA